MAIFTLPEALSTKGRQANASRHGWANSVPLGSHCINSSNHISINRWYIYPITVTTAPEKSPNKPELNTWHHKKKRNLSQQIKCIHTSRCKMRSQAALKCSILRRELEVVVQLPLLQLTLNVCMHRSWAQHPLSVMPLVVGSLLWQLHIYSLDQTVRVRTHH